MVTKPPVNTRITPNRSNRHGIIRFVIEHDTAGTYPGDLNWLTSKASLVSSDFYIRRDGQIWQLNPDPLQYKTWHAGISSYRSYSNLNEYALGIEMEHASQASNWPDVQIAACTQLTAWLVEEFQLDMTLEPIVSHARVAMPPGRKSDPRGFPWPDFMTRVRKMLGLVKRKAKLIWPMKLNPIPLELLFVQNASFTDGNMLSYITGLTPLVPFSEDGLVAVRPFFEAHGFRVEWNSQKLELRILPQDA